MPTMASDEQEMSGSSLTRMAGGPIEWSLREAAPFVLATVARRFRDFAAAEDAVQEACLAASVQWPRDGLPADARAWLIRVAFRRLADQARSDAARRHRESEFTWHAEIHAEPEPFPASQRMTILSTCCSCAATQRLPRLPPSPLPFEPLED